MAAIYCNIGAGGGAKCRGNEGLRMPLLSGTDIIFLVNYIRESEWMFDVSRLYPGTSYI